MFPPLRPRTSTPADCAARGRAESTLRNRNLTVDGHRTSVKLEPAMWNALAEICRRERKDLNRIATEIDQRRRESTLTAGIRVFVLEYFRAAGTEQGHRLAGHGGWPASAAAGTLDPQIVRIGRSADPPAVAVASHPALG